MSCFRKRNSLLHSSSDREFRISSKECQGFLICLNRRVAAFPHRRSNPGRLQAKAPPLPP